MMQLRFERAIDGTTVLRERRVAYPFAVIAPLRDARVLVQSVSGGLFGGERLDQRVVAGADAAATVEVPAATTVHEMRDGAHAEQRIELRAEAGARLAWLTRPAILFPTSRLRQRIEITLGEAASVVACDGFLGHDASGRDRPFGWYESTLVLARTSGEPLALDRSRAEGGMVKQAIPGVGGRHRAFGTVLRAGYCPDGLMAEARGWLDGQAGLFAGVTELGRGAGLLARIAAEDGGQLHMALERLGRLFAKG